MWVMTSFGILMPSLRPPNTVAEGDTQTLQVRSRRRKDLEILRDEYMKDDLGPILGNEDFPADHPPMDYNFRAYCTPEAFGVALTKITADIDFEKFKPTTESKYKDAELHSVYNAIWSTVCRLGEPWDKKNRVKSVLGAQSYSVPEGTAIKSKGRFAWDTDPYDWDQGSVGAWPRHRNDWVCNQCGSTKVYEETWESLNDASIIERFDSYWCNKCDKPTTVVKDSVRPTKTSKKKSGKKNKKEVTS